ncbi:hypothetical protein CPB86DRAFT_388981 [Serendipita vermifera]|nr:hypothetical protein CPB86DRAFT_388981 [Serendipita vermifera]
MSDLVLLIRGDKRSPPPARRTRPLPKPLPPKRSPYPTVPSQPLHVLPSAGSSAAPLPIHTHVISVQHHDIDAGPLPDTIAPTSMPSSYASSYMKRNSFHTASNSSSGSDGPHSDIITIGFGRRPSGAQGSLRNYPYNGSANSSIESFRANTPSTSSNNGHLPSAPPSRATGSLVPGSSSTSAASSTLTVPSVAYNPAVPAPIPAVAMTPDSRPSTSPSRFPTSVDNTRTANKRTSTGNSNAAANIQTPMGEAPLYGKKTVDSIDRTVASRPSTSRESTSSSIQTLSAPAAQTPDRLGTRGVVGGPREASSWDPKSLAVRIHTASPGPPPSQALPPIPYGRRLSAISTLSNQTRDSIPSNNSVALEHSHPYNRSTPPPAYTAQNLPIVNEKATFSSPPRIDIPGLEAKKEPLLEFPDSAQDSALNKQIKHVAASVLSTASSTLTAIRRHSDVHRMTKQNDIPLSSFLDMN